MKYVEFGPVHTRTFLEMPKNPLGQVIAISDSDYESIKHLHPSTWKAKDLKIVPRRLLSLKVKLILAGLAGFVLGLLVQGLL